MISQADMIVIKDNYVASQGVAPRAMKVKEVIDALSNLTRSKYVMIDFGYKAMFSDFETDSWRGAYEYPAVFETDDAHTVEWCIGNLKLTDGKEVAGYKGGEFILSETRELYIETEYSSSSASGVIEIIETTDYVIIKTMKDLY